MCVIIKLGYFAKEWVGEEVKELHVDVITITFSGTYIL